MVVKLVLSIGIALCLTRWGLCAEESGKTPSQIMFIYDHYYIDDIGHTIEFLALHIPTFPIERTAINNNNNNADDKQFIHFLIQSSNTLIMIINN